jgi:hypothetical protein
MLDNMTRAYNKATDAAVIAELTASGTQATAVAATSAGLISYVSTEAPAAYLATGELATKYIAGTSQWSLLLGATDSTGRPIYNAANPMNNAGSSVPTFTRNVLGLDLYVDPNAVSQLLMSQHLLLYLHQYQFTSHLSYAYQQISQLQAKLKHHYMATWPLVYWFLVAYAVST